MMNYDSYKTLFLHLLTLFCLSACASTTGPAEKAEKIGAAAFKQAERVDPASVFSLAEDVCPSGSSYPAKKTEKIGVFKQVERADQAYIRGQWIEAERYYQSVTEKAPNDYYAWFRLGNTRLRQDRLPGAIQSYKTASQRNPELAKPYYNLATAYLLQAQKVLQQSWDRLSAEDPGRLVIAQKLEQLKQLVYTQKKVSSLHPGDSLSIKKPSLTKPDYQEKRVQR